VPKLTKGKPITITLSEYMQSKLEQLVNQKQLTKSAVITLALEYYARAEERKMREEKA